MTKNICEGPDFRERWEAAYGKTGEPKVLATPDIKLHSIRVLSGAVIPPFPDRYVTWDKRDDVWITLTDSQTGEVAGGVRVLFDMLVGTVDQLVEDYRAKLTAAFHAYAGTDEGYANPGKLMEKQRVEQKLRQAQFIQLQRVLSKYGHHAGHTEKRVSYVAATPHTTTQEQLATAAAERALRRLAELEAGAPEDESHAAGPRRPVRAAITLPPLYTRDGLQAAIKEFRDAFGEPATHVFVPAHVESTWTRAWSGPGHEVEGIRDQRSIFGLKPVWDAQTFMLARYEDADQISREKLVDMMKEFVKASPDGITEARHLHLTQVAEAFMRETWTRDDWGGSLVEFVRGGNRVENLMGLTVHYDQPETFISA